MSAIVTSKNCVVIAKEKECASGMTSYDFSETEKICVRED